MRTELSTGADVDEPEASSGNPHEVAEAGCSVIDRRRLIGGGLAIGASISARRIEAKEPATQWTFDNLQTVGMLPIDLAGAPTLTSSPWGPAMMFDGIGDGLFVEQHPLAGAQTFTIEALFRPDGGAFEQRWLHLESDQQPALPPGKSDTRMMFEIRVVGDRWYLDAFMTGSGYRQAMMVPEKTFPVGQWHHVAQSYDGRIFRSFVDGALQMAVAVPFSPQGPGRASVGVRLNRVNFFRGAIRQARFSRRALSPAQFSYDKRR